MHCSLSKMIDASSRVERTRNIHRLQNCESNIYLDFDHVSDFNEVDAENLSENPTVSCKQVACKY